MEIESQNVASTFSICSGHIAEGLQNVAFYYTLTQVISSGQAAIFQHASASSRT